MAKVRSLMMIIDNDITVMVHGDSIFLARWSTTDDDDIAHISQHRSGVLISSWYTLKHRERNFCRKFTHFLVYFFRPR